jgi:hypothetical protein
LGLQLVDKALNSASEIAFQELLDRTELLRGWNRLGGCRPGRVISTSGGRLWRNYGNAAWIVWIDILRRRPDLVGWRPGPISCLRG